MHAENCNTITSPDGISQTDRKHGVCIEDCMAYGHEHMNDDDIIPQNTGSSKEKAAKSLPARRNGEAGRRDRGNGKSPCRIPGGTTEQKRVL